MSQIAKLPYGLMAELGRVPAGSPPPVHLWEPTNRYAIDLCIKANGDWVHEGALIERPRLVRLLASVLRRIGEDYFLVTPAEACQITVEDAPFLAVSLLSKGQGINQQLSIITNVGDEIAIGAQHPLTFHALAEAPVPYVEVRDGLLAKFNRPCYYDCMGHLAEAGGSDDASLGLWSGGLFYAVPEMGESLDGDDA